MRIPLFYALSAALLLAGCSDESNPTPPKTTAQAEVTAPTPAPAAVPPAAAAAPAKDAVFNQEQLDQMLAPIALYPDPLLAQVLMAATYPGNVAEAAAWSRAHPDAKGDDAVKQVATQPWDPSVQSLVAFPQVLELLGQDAAWTQRLGDAFLAQPDDVMDAVQRLRRQAQSAGNLESNQYQNVTVQQTSAPAPAPAPAQVAPASPSTIVIAPADPQVVYVPAYNPTTVYGTWAYPASPPVYYPPSPAYTVGTALVAGLAFGAGVAIVNSLWGDCDWGNNDIDINTNRYNNINVNNRLNANQNNWTHNSIHRDGVPYRDRNSREQYGRRLDGVDQRAAFRGDNSIDRTRAREQARASLDQRGIAAPASSNLEARQRAREATADRTQPGSGAAREQRQTRDQARGEASQRLGNRQQQGGVQHTARDQSSSQARQAARQQYASTSAGSRNNAFAGARSPSRANMQADRGRASQAAAQRPASARAAGHQISRPSRPPQRQSRRR
ncbi:MAG: DUF3300 domain-containing protein [Pseudomonas sp.]